MKHSGPNLVTLGHLMTSPGAKKPDSGLFGASKELYNGPLGAPMGAQKVWKWVGDACPVDMGQLDHCVVLGTKSGAVQDFQ